MRTMNSTTTNCLIIAGEKSGEEHSESFLPELIKESPQTKFFGVGGDYFRKLGVETFYDIKDFASMGISEVLTKIPFYLKAEERLLEEVDKRQCRTAILIDFQGFNLKLAKKLKKKNVRVLYYVAPQAWAWKSHRAKTVGDNIHSLFSIIPFEKKWFAQRGTDKIISIAHPLFLKYRDDLQEIPPRDYESLESGINLLLLPGSRNSEVRSLLPEYLKAAKRLRAKFQVNVRIVKTNSVENDIYDFFGDEIEHVYESNELADALKWTHFSLAASGTVTLACALFEVPTVVSYKTTLLNWFLYSNLVKYKGFVSLGNIVLEQAVFPELLQDDANEYLIFEKLNKWIMGKSFYEKTKNILSKTKISLTGEDINIPNYMARVINENN